MSRIVFWMVLGVLVSFAATDGLFAQNQNSSEGDRQALMDLYNSTNGKNWEHKTGWSGSSIDLSDEIWGVRVESVNGELRVVHLDLQRGSKYPPAPGSDDPNIMPGNNLSGELPASIGNLSKIKYFNVKQNFLVGGIPESIGNWTKVERVLLSGHTREPEPGAYNHPEGSGVASDWVDGKNVYAINAFTGSLPSTVKNMRALRIFESQQNTENGGGLSGAIPSEWGSELTVLILSANKLTGAIPAGLANTKLRDLHLQENNLSGSLLPELGQLTQMNAMRLQKNNFEGQVPQAWDGFQSLKFLYLNSNNLTGPFPSFLFQGGRNPLFSTIRLEYNDFDGLLPQDIDPQDYRHWNVLSLAYNNFSGPIPNWVPQLRLIQHNFDHNNFSGDLPAGYHDSDSRLYQRIRNLRLNNNNLTGPIPQANPGPENWQFHMHANNFTGSISENLGKTETTRNMQITLQNNSLSGTVPVNLSTIENLSQLNLSSNRFSEGDLSGIKSAIESSVDFRYGNQDPSNDDNDDGEESPDSPEPLSPVDGSSSVSLTPTFEWNDQGADSYMLHISADGQAGETLEVDGSAFTLNESLDPDTAYEWKVRGVTGTTEGEWSDVWQFTTEPAEDEVVLLPAPARVSPDNHGIYTETPTFEWTAVEGADYYVLHSNSVAPAEMVIVEDVNETSYTPNGPLAEGTVYHWRVQAVSESLEGEWSEIWEFEIEETEDEIITELSVPALVAPADEAENIPNLPAFEWTEVEGAENYILQSTTLNSGEMAIYEVVSGTQFKPEAPLEDQTSYQWRVRAVANSGSIESGWSELRQFTTEDTEDSGDDEVITELPAPALVTPDHESDNISTRPIFEWTAVEDADHYILHSNRLDPAEMVIEEVVHGTSFTPENSLEEATSYHWRVRAVLVNSDTVEGKWSELRQFTTEGTDDSDDDDIITELAAPALVSPADYSDNISNLPSFEWSAVDGADSYLLHINVAGQPGGEIDVLVDGTTYAISDSLENGTSYVWRVRGITEDVEGEWSELWQFTTEEAVDDGGGDDVITELSAPALVSPADSADNISTRPAFEWSAVEGADSYLLHINVAGQPGEQFDVHVEGTTYALSDSLEYGTSYVWRVRGVTEDVEGEWSELWQFTTEKEEDSGDDAIAELSAPDLIAPGHETLNISTQPVFEWTEVENADYYVLHSNKLNPSGLVMYEVVSGTSYTPEEPLDENVSYNWRVRAVTDTVESEWSDVREFTTGVDSNDEVLVTPNLISPSNRMEFETLLPTFEWQHVEAEYYLITVIKAEVSQQKVNELNTGESGTVVISEEVSDTLYTPEQELDPDSEYSWRVKPVLDGEGEWSETWEFKTPAKKTVNNEPDERAFTTDLYQNYPNPFNPNTQIEFTLSEVQNVSLKVYDLAGREVAKLADEVHRAGRHSITFNAGSLASGVYFYRFIADSKVVTKKMTLVK